MGRTGGRLDEAFDRTVVIEIYVHLAQDTQLLGRLRESKNGDGIAIDVAQPTHGRRRLDVEARPRNMDVVALARPQQRAVWGQK